MESNPVLSLLFDDNGLIANTNEKNPVFSKSCRSANDQERKFTGNAISNSRKGVPLLDKFDMIATSPTDAIVRKTSFKIYNGYFKSKLLN